LISTTKKTTIVSSRIFEEKIVWFEQQGKYYRFSSSVEPKNKVSGAIYGTTILNFGVLEPQETGSKYTLLL
jgi:hypothetical protein